MIVLGSKDNEILWNLSRPSIQTIKMVNDIEPIDDYVFIFFII